MEGIMHTTTQETHSVIASDRVEGTPVRSTDGTRVGTIERVMIDKLTGNVAYAVMRLNAFGMVQERLPIAWARLTYDRKVRSYRIDLTEMELSGAPSHESHKDFDWGEREIEIHGPYWGIAERW
jgi:hypothetical protein